MKVRGGTNRLIVRWFWGSLRNPQVLLLSVCDGADVSKSVRFVRCPVAPAKAGSDAKSA